MKKLLFTLVLLTTTVSAYSQILNWNATQNKSYSPILKGDANDDGEVDISDVVFVVNEILSGDSYQDLCDVNYDGYVDISDVVELVNIILNGNQTHLCPDDNHPHWIDLGLPSGTLWCCCNEGASTPEDYGGYYTFDEVYSAPTLDQIKELLNNTTSELTIQNDIYGRTFTGSNGGTIFLPFAGDPELGGHGNLGFYWSSSLLTENENCAYYLYFTENYVNWGGGFSLGNKLTVRPVSK